MQKSADYAKTGAKGKHPFSRLRCFFMQRPRSFVAFCRFLEYNHLYSGCRSDQNPAKTVGSEEDNMMIINIENKRDYISLLLLADEQENMIDRYLDRGTMYVLEDGGIVKGECVVTDEGGGVLEIQNLAIAEEYQRQGYGKALIEFIADRYKNQYEVLQVGTGDGPLTVPFYENCGFTKHHIRKNYMVDYYDNPIYEGGRQLIDKVYLWRRL